MKKLIKKTITITNHTKIKTPKGAEFRKWVDFALPDEKNAEITIVIVDEPSITKLNQAYKHKPTSTNVLSFLYEESPLIGEIILCANVIKNEAKDQRKAELSHWSHLTIHGVLHLLGYEHNNEKNAAIMEAQEIKVLTNLGFSNPYVILVTNEF